MGNYGNANFTIPKINFFFPWLVYVCHSPVMATWLGSASMSQTVWWSTVAALRHWTWRRKKTHGSPPWIIWYSTRLESDKPSIKYWFQSQLYIIIYIYYILYIILYIYYIIYIIYKPNITPNKLKINPMCFFCWHQIKIEPSARRWKSSTAAFHRLQGTSANLSLVYIWYLYI